jgi:hypothetical protein
MAPPSPDKQVVGLLKKIEELEKRVKALEEKEMIREKLYLSNAHS